MYRILTIAIFFLTFHLNIFPQDTIQSLIQKLNDKDQFVNGAAINELVLIGEPAVEYLIKSLQVEDENVRWCSAIALEKISPAGKQAIPFLINALQDKNSDVRWCSALALGKFHTDAVSAISELQKLLSDEDYNVRWAAYISLSKIDKKYLNVTPNLSQKISAIEKTIPELMEELNVPGVSISIISDKNIFYSKSFGIADANTKVQVDENTMFEACSMSKPVFVFLVLKLVEQGKLELDNPLYEYLPENFICEDEEYPKQITARMILSHTSGLPNWRKGSEENESPLPIYFKPGTKFQYSGEGIYYLQRVVEHITNEPLESYAKRNLFDKLGLESTSFVWTEEYDQQIAT